MINENKIKEILSFLERDLVDQILKYSEVELFKKGTVLIREGQYLKHLPVILEGAVKVYSQHEDKELLLYYIIPKQSCISSFSAATYNFPSRISAITEMDSEVLLLPVGKVSEWTKVYPRFNQLFFDLYHQRYLDLLETINQLVFNRLDERLFLYLKELSIQLKTDMLNIRHHEIAKDLGTAREVITRTIKKLEKEHKIRQTSNGIKILTGGD